MVFFFMLYNMVFIKVLVYLSSATCTMNLQNPKNGTELPSRYFANPLNRYQKVYKKHIPNEKFIFLFFYSLFSCKLFK